MRFLIMIFCLLGWCFDSNGSRAEDRKITVAVGDWPPYISQKQKHDGAIAHLIRDIFTDEGIEAEIQFLPWGRAYAETADGKYQATGVWMHKDEREADFHYSDPVLTEQFVFFHRKDREFHWKSLEDLSGLRIGGGVKYSYGPIFDQALETGLLHMERVPAVRQNISKLLLGRIDIFPEEVNVGYASLRDHFTAEEQRRITHHKTPLLNNLSYLLFPKKSADSVILMEKFNNRLRIYREIGLYDRYLNDLRDGQYL
ncbi:substrate-binding periplasmic protein [Aestuariispira insulae]|uniref:Amino acid ABC transporter substrate-binding protein (PAAT family) n=1 Tax=Aestuariispira insulae TaxID=1461337 RepID=A0A3D9HR67_9PROT|nr:transporter substrate-binding domain-containing protein [Aestuariispira insulae]RED52007.1 amino acid ABC transporter substrate-binding protein (PAAT family) [Aestuariispira insulae]